MDTYTVNRSGQLLGPYSLAEIRQYLSDGRIGQDEVACRNGDQRWMPVSRLISSCSVAQKPPVQNLRPAPPSLHWALVLFFSVATGGLFSIVWMFVQSSFVKKIDPASRTTALYAAATVCTLRYFFACGSLAPAIASHADLNSNQVFILGLGAMSLLAGAIAMLMGIFSVRGSLEMYYRDVEPLGTNRLGKPVGLRLSGVLTFFFNIYYVQYHLTRLARWRDTGVLT